MARRASALAKRVIEAHVRDMYPQADIFTHVYVPEWFGAQPEAAPCHSDLHQRAAARRADDKTYLPMMPLAPSSSI